MSEFKKCLIFVSVLFLGLNLNSAYAGNDDPVPPAPELNSFLMTDDLFEMRLRIAVHGSGAATAQITAKDPFESIPVLNRIRQTFARDMNKFGIRLMDLGPGPGPDFIIALQNNKRPR